MATVILVGKITQFVNNTHCTQFTLHVSKSLDLIWYFFFLLDSWDLFGLQQLYREAESKVRWEANGAKLVLQGQPHTCQSQCQSDKICTKDIGKTPFLSGWPSMCPIWKRPRSEKMLQTTVWNWCVLCEGCIQGFSKVLLTHHSWSSSPVTMITSPSVKVSSSSLSAWQSYMVFTLLILLFAFHKQNIFYRQHVNSSQLQRSPQQVNSISQVNSTIQRQKSTQQVTISQVKMPTQHHTSTQLHNSTPDIYSTSQLISPSQ